MRPIIVLITRDGEDAESIDQAAWAFIEVEGQDGQPPFTQTLTVMQVDDQFRLQDWPRHQADPHPQDSWRHWPGLGLMANLGK